ncbi:SDR family NAD(P)-dependent oxidoreductase [Algimonas arctica]|nr:SDR family oxidoreductase [Algimonas arctica]
MTDASKRTMLITGASAGIGAALAREYAGRGWNLIVTARRTERLEALKAEIEAVFEVKVECVTADLMADGAVDMMLAEIKGKGLTVDGLINNAGYGHPGLFLDSSWEEHDKFNRLMVDVVVEATRKLLPGMVERGYGRVMNVASLAGHLPGSKGHTLYAAVKAYLLKFSQSLNVEMEGTGVYVSALCPGFVITEFHDVNGTREGINQLPSYMTMSAAECARLAADALEANKDVFIPGKVNRTIARLGRFLPQSRVKSMLRKRSESYRNTGEN